MTIALNFRQILDRKNSRNGLWQLPLGMVAVVMVYLAMRSETFTGSNLLNLAGQAAPLLLASLGQLMVVLIGGLDLSVGAVISLSTAILTLDAPLWVLLPTVFLSAAFVGVLNGLAVSKLNVHPIIATLSTMSLVQGATLLVRPVAGGNVPDAVMTAVNATPLGIPMSIVWVGVAIAVCWRLVHHSRLGLHLFAVGGGSSVARSYGVSVERTTVAAYVLSSTFAAAAGVFLAGRIASGDPKIGELFAIESITAVALGGVQLAGGVGSVPGALTGVVLLALLANGMNLENMSAFIQTAVKGLILLAVIAMQPRKTIGL